MNVITGILETMTTISTPQRKFIMTLLTTIQLLRGRMTFRNLSRYSGLHEITFRRQFQQPFDFVAVNLNALTTWLPPQTTKIAALDCTFVPKSGTHTAGLDQFYHAIAKRAEPGLEFSELAIVEVPDGSAYHLSIRQTPDRETILQRLGAGKTRMDWYLDHLTTDRPHVPAEIRYVAIDGAYAHRKFIEGVCDLNLHAISRLRSDARLRHLFVGPHPKRRGARQRYAGAFTREDLRWLTPIPVSDTITLYSTIVNSVALKRDIRLVVVTKRHGTRLLTALLFSTDTTLTAELIYTYYTARFQIEFLFRDAKQYTGLADFQTRDADRIAFHVQAAMTALNALKIEDRLGARHDPNHVISIQSWKLRKFNEHQLERFIAMFGLDPMSIKSHPHYEECLNYGTIAA